MPWDNELEGMGKLEDSRLKRIEVTHPTLPMQRTYCCNCGAPYGWVTEESSNFIAAQEIIVFCQQCDNDLSLKYGQLPLHFAGDENTHDFPLLRDGIRIGESNDKK